MTLAFQNAEDKTLPMTDLNEIIVSLPYIDIM